MESDMIIVHIPVISYKEWLRIWHGIEPSDFGLKCIVDEVKCADDVDDLDMFEVVNEQLFFLSAVKHGFEYKIFTQKLVD